MRWHPEIAAAWLLLLIASVWMVWGNPAASPMHLGAWSLMLGLGAAGAGYGIGRGSSHE